MNFYTHFKDVDVVSIYSSNIFNYTRNVIGTMNDVLEPAYIDIYIDIYPELLKI